MTILGWVLKACFGNFRWPVNVYNQYCPGYCSPFPWGTWGEGQSRWERGDNWVYEHVYGGPVSVPAGRIVGSFSPGQPRFPCRVLEGLGGFLELIPGIQSLMGLLSTLTPTLPSYPVRVLCSSIFIFQMDLHDWRCHCRVKVSPIFFLGPAIAQTTFCCHHGYRAFLLSQYWKGYKRFTSLCRFNVFTSPVFILSSNMYVLNNCYVSGTVSSEQNRQNFYSSGGEGMGMAVAK